MKKVFLTLLFMSFLYTGFAQTETIPPAVDNTLNGQFQYLRKKSGSYQQYKVIDKVKLNNFWAVVADSVKNYKGEIETRDAKISELNKTISEQKVTIEAKTQEVQSHIEVEEQINVLGINMLKSTFKVIFWVLIGLLAGGLAYFIFMFKKAKVVADAKVKMYSEISSELEERKQKHRDDLVKLKRELQTERNTIEEMKKFINSQKLKF